MSRVLVDSSIWVGFFGGDTAIRDRVFALSRDPGVVTCEPVMMEILAGGRGSGIHRIEAFLNGFGSLSVRPALDFRLAAALRRRLRDQGMTIRSGMDALIATVALHHDASVLHQDADFERIAAVTELRQERWTA